MRRGIEFSFAWIFSLIVGALILTLAVYVVTTWVGQERTVSDSESAQALSGLLSPLQTSVETSFRPNPIVFPQPTEVTLGCSDHASTVQTRALSTIGRNTAPGYAQETAGITVFGNTTLTGTTLHSVIVPFLFPYKVRDLVIVWMGSLCFVQAPDSVLQVFGSDNQSVQSVDSIAQCTKGSRTICFDETRGCQVTVDQYLKRVSTEGKTLYYEDALLYGALVARPDFYECHVRSLVGDTERLARLYAEMSAVVGTRSEGCTEALGSSVQLYRNSLSATNSSRQLARIAEEAQALDAEERVSTCSLWRNA